MKLGCFCSVVLGSSWFSFLKASIKLLQSLLTVAVLGRRGVGGFGLVALG